MVLRLSPIALVSSARELVPAPVHVAQQGAEVVAADGFLVGPRARPAVGAHRVRGS